MPQIQFKIGSDPELGIISNKGKQITAPYLIKHQTNVGVGFDGHRDIMEVRPGKGDFCPLNHVTSLKICLASLIRRTNFFNSVRKKAKIVAGSMVKDDPMGGHIHFATDNMPYMNSSTLDLFIAVPIMMISNPKTHIKRATKIFYGSYPYGSLGNTRIKSYGVEYKTPPSWLVSMGFARSILCLAFVVGYEMHKGETLPRFSDLGNRYVDYYILAKRNKFTKIIPRIFKHVRDMEKYPLYAREIASLFGLIKAFNKGKLTKTWEEDKCILERWRITEKWSKKRHPIEYDERLENIIDPFIQHKWRKSIKIYVPKRSHPNSGIIVHPTIAGRSTMWGLNLAKGETLGDYEIMIGIPKTIIKDSSKEQIQIAIDNILKNSQTYRVGSSKRSQSEIKFDPVV